MEKPNTVVISIGRNVGKTDTLSLGDWAAFKSHLRATAFRYGTPVFAGQGTGVYEGREEESYTLILTDLRPDVWPTLRADLVDLADVYDQEAIAVTHGTVQFIPNKEEVQT